MLHYIGQLNVQHIEKKACKSNSSKEKETKAVSLGAIGAEGFHLLKNALRETADKEHASLSWEIVWLELRGNGGTVSTGMSRVKMQM